MNAEHLSKTKKNHVLIQLPTHERNAHLLLAFSPGTESARTLAAYCKMIVLMIFRCKCGNLKFLCNLHKN